MTISEILDNEEDLEPETIRYFLPDASEEDIEWIMAARTVKQTTHFLEDMYVFENVVRALNKLSVDFDRVQGTSPQHIWYALDVIKKLWKDIDIQYSWEVRKYIEYIFGEYGMYGLSPFTDHTYEPYYKITEILLNPNITDLEINENDPIHLKGQKLAEMLLYSTRMNRANTSQ